MDSFFIDFGCWRFFIVVKRDTLGIDAHDGCCGTPVKISSYCMRYSRFSVV